MADVVLLLVLAAAAYGVGVGIVAGPLALVGVGFVGGAATLLVLAMPLASVLLVEGTTRLWRHTPGSLGLGGLTLLGPMLIAGVASAIVARCLHAFASPFDSSSPREGPALDLRLAGALGALALWRFWPEPRARLW